MKGLYPNFPKEKWLQDIYLRAYSYAYAYTKTMLAFKGGPGSGNFGHAGRPGEAGGSAMGGAVGMSPDRVEPVNEITSQSKFEDLVSSMKENGWQGLPILAYEGGNGMQAVTGSHRIYAAREAGLDEIPVSVLDFQRGEIDYDTFEEDINAFLEARRDEDILEVFDDYNFVEKGYITQDQYYIFKKEVENNG